MQIYLKGKALITTLISSKTSKTKMNDENIKNVTTEIEKKELVFSLLTSKDEVSEIKMTSEGKPITIQIEASLVDKKDLPQ